MKLSISDITLIIVIGFITAWGIYYLIRIFNELKK